MLRESLLKTTDNLKVEATSYCLTIKVFKDIVDNQENLELYKDVDTKMLQL